MVWGVLSLIVHDLAPTATQSPHLSLLGPTPTSIGNEQYALSVQPSLQLSPTQPPGLTTISRTRELHHNSTSTLGPPLFRGHVQQVWQLWNTAAMSMLHRWYWSGLCWWLLRWYRTGMRWWLLMGWSELAPTNAPVEDEPVEAVLG